MKSNQFGLIDIRHLFAGVLLLLGEISMANVSVVACVGDSITFGHSINNPLIDAYPSVLQRLMGDDWHVRNFGANGATAINNTPELTPYLKRHAYEESLISAPSIVIIMLGSNDSKPAYWNAEEYSRDIISLIFDYKSLPSKPEILLVTPVSSYSESKNQWDVSESNLDQLRRILINDISKKTGTEVIQISAMSRNLFVSDGVHPNEDGARVIASSIYNHLKDKFNRAY